MADSIYYIEAELTALKALITEDSHSTIYNNIKTWADAHIEDALFEEEGGDDWWYWIVDADTIRRFVDTMAFMYHMTDDTDYADAGVTWLVGVAGFSKWGPTGTSGSGWGRARFAKAMAYGYSVLKDYMSEANKATVETAMADNVAWLIAYLSSNWGITSTPFSGASYIYMNHWGTIAFGAGLSAVALSDHGDYATWIAVVTNVMDTYLDNHEDDGFGYGAMNYMMSPMSFLVPLVEAYKRVGGGSDYYDEYSTFFGNHAYPYIYLHYTLESIENYIPIGDDEPSTGITPDHPNCTPIDDIIYPLSKEAEDGYAQQYADTYCRQDLMTSYIWKSSSVTSLALSGLPLSRVFSDFGLVVMRENWDMDCLVIVDKCGRSVGHLHPDQNSFTVVDGGLLLSGNQGYMYGTEAETRMNNCVVVDDVIDRSVPAYYSEGGQFQEAGDFGSDGELGTKGTIAESDITSNHYVYVRGDAAAMYDVSVDTDKAYGDTEWTGSEGGTVGIAAGAKEEDDHISKTLNVALRHLVFMKNPNYFVVFDEVEAPSSAEHTFCLNGISLAIDGDTITLGTNKMKSVILEPSSFSSLITTYDVNKSWIEHDYDVIRFHASENSAAAKFLTVHFIGTTALPSTKIEQGNLIGAKVSIGGGEQLDLILFSTDGEPVSETIDLGAAYEALDGFPADGYSFDGDNIIVAFDTWKVVRCQAAGEEVQRVMVTS